MNLRETAALSIVGLTSHKLRTLLTMLGIIFGVAAVIAMLSIGEGAKQESLEQIRQMGISNIIVQHWDKSEDGLEDAINSDRNLSQGLSREDAEAIQRIFPLAEYVTPQREFKSKALAGSNTFNTMVNVHLDATEHEDHVVFMHHIQEGPANRSFGLEVAKLAGVPNSVIRQARAKLEELESGSSSDVISPTQSDLFSVKSAPSPVVDFIDDLDPDSLSPRDALEALYQAKKLLDK